jgi:DNA-binding response OmpR family regulator
MTSVILGAWRAPPAAREGKILIDVANRTLTRGADVVRLCPGEFIFAVVLLSAAGRTLSRKELMEAMYGDREDGGPLSKALDVYLCRVRRSLLCIGVRFETVWGRGICALIDVPEAAE